MGKLTGTRYLFQRRGRYFVRVRVPRDVAHVFPRPFVETFLGTADKGEARDKVEQAVAEIKARFKNAREGARLTPGHIRYEKIASARIHYEKIAADPLSRSSTETFLGYFEQHPELGREGYVRALREQDIEPDEGSIQALHEAWVESIRIAREWWEHRVPPPPLPPRPSPRQGSPEALGGRLDAWLEQKRTRRGRRLVTASQSIARKAIRRLAERFPRIEDVTKEAVETWCREMVDAGMNPATVRRMLPLWRDYWRWLKVPGASPFDGLKLASPGKSNKEAFTRDEVVALLDVSRDNPRLYNAILLAAYTGMRLGEIVALRCEHVDLVKGSILVAAVEERAGKSDSARRTIPIHPALLPFLTELKSPKHDYIIRWDGPAKNVARCNWITKAFTELAHKHNLDHDRRCTFHSLRHTFISELISEGVERWLAKVLGGHSDRDITSGEYGREGAERRKRRELEKLTYDRP